MHLQDASKFTSNALGYWELKRDVCRNFNRSPLPLPNLNLGIPEFNFNSNFEVGPFPFYNVPAQYKGTRVLGGYRETAARRRVGTFDQNIITSLSIFNL